MKKLSYVLLVFAMLFTVSNAKAMTKSESIEKLTKTYVIDGEEIKISEAQKVEVERYLDKYELTSEEADYIAGKVDEVVAIAQESKAKSFSDLTSAEVDKIVSIVSNVSENTKVNATLTKGGKLTIYEDEKIISVKEIQYIDGQFICSGDNLNVNYYAIQGETNLKIVLNDGTIVIASLVIN